MFDSSNPGNQRVKERLSQYKTPLIIGAIVDNNGETLNTSILWTKDRQDVYAKQHLTPFGEYIPLRSIAQVVSPLVNQVDDFSAGNDSKTFTVGTATIAHMEIAIWFVPAHLWMTTGNRSVGGVEPKGFTPILIYFT